MKYAADALKEIQSICLDLQIHFAVSGNPPDFANDQELVQRALTKMGLTIEKMDAACDARLVVNASFTPLSAVYSSSKGPRTCFNGASLNGDLILRKTGLEDTKVSLNTQHPSADGMIYNCFTEPEAPFDSVWVEAVLNGLYQIWGSAPVLMAVQDDGSHHPHGCNPETITFGSDLLLEQQKVGEIIPVLVQMLKNPDLTYCKPAIASSLGEGGKYMGSLLKDEVVPALIAQLKEDGDPSVCNALVAVTKVDIHQENLSCDKKDAIKWETWWAGTH